MTDESSLDPSAAEVLGRVPSGLFILTASQGERSTGMLASWVMQAGFDPPTLTVAVKLGRYLADWLTDGALFALHLLGEDDGTMLKHFGRGFEPGEPAFEGLNVTINQDGVPILGHTLGHLLCKPLGHQDSGDHRVFLAEVTGGKRAGDDAPRVHIRKSGLNY